VVGENMVVKGLDEDLIGKQAGYEGRSKLHHKTLLDSEFLN